MSEVIRLDGDETPALREAFESIDRRFNERASMPGLFGLGEEFDTVLSVPVERGTLVAVGGVAGIGTSTLVLQMALRFSANQKKPVLWSTTAQPYQAVVERLISLASDVAPARLIGGNIRPHEWEQISEGFKNINETPLRIDDTPPTSVAHIRDIATRIKDAEGLGAVFIDTFLQMLPNPNLPRYRRHEELTDISRDLVSLTRDLACPVFVTATWPLSVAPWANALHQGDAKDLYLFGPLASDADVDVLLQEQQEGYDRTGFERRTLILARVLKNRRLRPLAAPLERDNETGVFRSYDRSTQT